MASTVLATRQLPGSSGGGLTWTVITASQTLVKTNGYMTNGGGLVIGTLPATASVGDEFVLSTLNAAGWKVAQNASQYIQIGNLTTTIGTGGYLQSISIGDSVRIVCSVANTGFIVVMFSGNITVI